ncbi:Hypothetical predicted protein [Mytilus galloprovincialis]|uniref:Uncharacterized protein n=1 Tax=Mytilus galloprovincialis TaxID=29158 RepID=A0A8B6FS17_MYTGA|nr:Hypothetical predicted protein [Mytilus galloprovincialis]
MFSVVVENVTQTRANLLKTDEEQKITNPTTTRNINSGILDREIVIYSVVAACILVILGLSYLVFKYKQKTVQKLAISNTVENMHSNSRHSLNNSNHSVYDEIDENMIVENLNINLVHINNSSFNDETHKNTDNTSYLHVIHSEDKSSSTSISVKSFNNSYLSFHESDQNTHSDQSQRDDDTTSYLHPYHTVDEDWKEKTHQYDITHVSNKDTDDSSDSSTQMISDGYLNPYQPLKDDWKQLSHSYEAPVTVHQCQQSLLIPFISNKETKGMKNIYKDERQTVEGEHDIYPSRSFTDKTELSENCHQSISMQNSPDKIKLKQPIHNDYIVGIMTSSKHKQLGAFDVTDAFSISPNKKIQDISESTNNNRWIIPNNLKSKSTSL